MTDTATHPPTHKRRGLRTALIGLGGLLVLAIAGIGIVAATFDPNSLKPRIQDAVRQSTGRDLALNGDIGIKLSLWPTIAARDVALANPPGFSRPQMATLRSLELRMALLPLLSRRIEIERLVLVGPDIRLETNAQGQPNWAIEPRRQPDQPASVPASAGEQSRGSDLFASVGTLRIEAGTLAWHDARSGRRHDLLIEALDMTSGADPAPLRVEGRMTLDSVPVTINGETGPLSRLMGVDPASPIPVALTLKVAGASASVQGSVTDPLGGRGYDATLQLAVPDMAALAPLLQGVAVPAAKDIALSVRVRGQGTDLPGIDRISLKTGPIVLPDSMKGVTIDRIEVSAPAIDQPVALQVAGRHGALPFSLSGSIGHPGLDPAAIRPLPVDLRLTAADAAVTVKGRIDKPSALAGVALDVAATVPDLAALSSVAGRPLPKLKSLTMQGQVSERGAALSSGVAVRNLRLTLPEADLSGDVFGEWSGHPSILANLASQRIDADALRALLATAEAAQTTAAPAPPAERPSGGRRTAGVIPDTPFPFAGLRALDADIRLRVGTLRWAKADYQGVEAHAELRGGRLRVDPFAATTPEGRVTGTVAVDASGSGPSRIHLTAHAPALSTAAIMAAAGARPVVSGPLELRADLTGTGDTVRAAAASLGGTLGVAMASGTIDTRALGGSVGSFAKDLPILDLLGRGGGMADIRCVAMRFDARDGVAQSRVLLLSSSLLTVDGGGSIDLRTETLNLLLRPQGRVAGNGFRVPIKVTGPMLSPRFEIDASGAAEANADKLAGIIIGRVNPQGTGPLGALGGLLGGDTLQQDGGTPCPAALALARGASQADSTAEPTGTAPPAPPPAQRPRREAPALPNAERLLRQLFR